ncbi:MAG TPA: translation elongation factor Ts [Syntrophales bacterium]|nr:translation elongation factor Ts [Syntrophales bacterium]HOX95190.1 translation elongation factor Ts [Syntrophales bacterium]HPI55872.1 translation elongation factor Ts [Syntrophales bacterium]HPN23637.1 translation elongation factor Ts [Syntrophales bacterium]HQM27838.1 translation elongation factor Ts [Syntrophales bacterium]
MEISAEKVKELRDKTGSGIMDCKEALKVAGGNMDKAIEHLREKGMSAATKKSSRATKEGAVTAYIHMGGKVGVMVELNCETDFVAKTQDFQSLSKDIAMHIAAMNPLYVRAEEVPPEVIESERGIYKKQALAEGKPEKIMERIIEGKLKKFYEDVCLMNQRFIKDQDMTIEKLVKNAIAKTGENIVVRRFVRYQLGV